MKDNKDIFTEASFFKKNTTYADRQKSKLPQYQPADVKSAKTPVATDAYQVTSTQEVKKRLAGTFGAAFGNNNIKGMASRATKTFPIIISDNIEPETAITLKKLMEDQYAEYINLLISNQVVNLADFRAGNTDGNIAIQALDSISGSDFSSTRAADIANRTGELKGEDVFANIPLYNLLRENNQVISTGDSITDALLENAVIVPSQYASTLINFMQNNADEIAELNEMLTYTPNGSIGSPSVGASIDAARRSETAKNIKLAQYMADLDADTDENIVGRIQNREMNRDALRGFNGLDDEGKEIYTKLTTADIVIDSKRMDQAINRSVGELLTRPENIEIRDKFEKATMLLQSNRISGMEFYQYCVLRLGIPVSEETRKVLALKFPIANVLSGRGVSGSGYVEIDGKRKKIDKMATINPDEAKAIANNRKTIEKVLKQIDEIKFNKVDFAKSIGAGAGIGAASGTAGYGIGITLGMSVVTGPLFLGALAGAAVGAAAYPMIKYLRNKRIQRINAKAKKEYDELMSKPNIEGWERVEALINQWDEQQEAIRNIANRTIKPQISNTLTDVRTIKDNQESIEDLADAERTIKYAKEYVSNMQMAQKNFNAILAESCNITESINATSNIFDVQFNAPECLKQLEEDVIDTCKYFSDDKELLKEMKAEKIMDTLTLTEKRKEIDYDFGDDDKKEYGDAYLTTQTVMDINNILKGNARQNVAVRYIDKQDDKDVLITPQFMATDNFAYGTTEIERKENKDRRYNQPLIMTVKFRGRFQDDKFADNELTAVIGILGKIVRVSSAEMEYILKENAEGNTIEGFFKNSKGDLANTISDLLATSKVSKDLKNLPQSADIWHNLEKVATLAAANKITGKRNKNIANAHIVFSQKEIDDVRNDLGIDYLKDIKKSVALMKRYSAFTIMVANDPGQRLYILDDQDAISWNAVPYSAIVGKDSGDQLNAFLTKMTRLN